MTIEATIEMALDTVNGIIGRNEERINELMDEINDFTDKNTNRNNPGYFFDRLERYLKDYDGYVNNINEAKAQRNAIEAIKRGTV